MIRRTDMERLTYDFCIGGNHCWQIKGADNLECREVCEGQGDAGCKTCPIAKAFDRLAAIEDILGDEYDLDELKEVVQAKREGRCVVLPAPLGSQVWQLKYPTRIDENGEEWVICSIKEATVEPAPFGLTLSMVNQIGKIYWLSKEEAQAALRREQDGNDK